MYFIANAFTDAFTNPDNPWYYALAAIYLVLVVGAVLAYVLVDRKKRAKEESEQDTTATESANDNATSDTTATENASGTATSDTTATESASDTTTSDAIATERASDTATTDTTATESANDTATSGATATESASDTATNNTTATESANDTATSDTTATESASDNATSDATATENASDTATESASDNATSDTTADDKANTATSDKGETAATIETAATNSVVDEADNVVAKKTASKSAAKKPTTKSGATKKTSGSAADGTTAKRTTKTAPFNERIAETESAHEFYNAAKNAIMSYAGVKAKLTKEREEFTCGDKTAYICLEDGAAVVYLFESDELKDCEKGGAFANAPYKVTDTKFIDAAFGALTEKKTHKKTDYVKNIKTAIETAQKKG